MPHPDREYYLNARKQDAERKAWVAERDRLVGSLLDHWQSCHREAGFALAEADHHELATALNRLYVHCDMGK